MAPRRTPGPPRMALLNDKDLARWHANVARGSPITADVYARRLGAFCDQVGIEPLALVKRSEQELRNVLLDFITAEERRKRAGSYIESTLKAVKSWLVHNGLKISLPLRIHGASDTPSLREERTPTQAEVRAILLAATPRDRVSCALMAFSGVRPEVLGNYRGNDGLRLGDLGGLTLKGKTVGFEQVPALLEVRKELSKADHRYFSFLGVEGCDYVRQYLEERLRSGEKLTLESDLIHPKGTGGSRDKSFVTTTNVGDGIRNSIRGAGYKWRPYVLRAYFDTQLLLAESKGKLAHDYRVFWMGHKGSMDARYTTNKGRLTKDLLDDMRAAYTRCEPFLSTVPTAEANDGATRVLRALLISRGHPKEEAEKLDIGAMTDEELGALFKKLAASTKRAEKAFAVDEVPRLLDAGWEFVAPLNGSLAVLRSPGGFDGEALSQASPGLPPGTPRAASG
jgi:integrase